MERPGKIEVGLTEEQYKALADIELEEKLITQKEHDEIMKNYMPPKTHYLTNKW